MKIFVFFQFNYCPLVWMCHIKNVRELATVKKLITKFNRLQERALRIVYNGKCSTLYQLLEKGKSATIHSKNLQYLATEIFKVNIGISPTIMTEILQFCAKEVFYEKTCSYKFRKIRRKTPVPESLL